MEEILPQWFLNMSAINQALFAGLFTWGMTSVGAGVVFMTKNVSQKLLDSMLGFVAGVLIAASVWSLIIPSLELPGRLGGTGWFLAAFGFLQAGIFLRFG